MPNLAQRDAKVGFLSQHESLVWLTAIAVEFDLSRHSSKLQVIEMNWFGL